MKVTIEIADEDAQIIQNWLASDKEVIQKCGKIDIAVMVQGWATAMVKYLKEMKLVVDAGVGLTVEEIQKTQRESIINILADAKKLSVLRKARSDNVH